MSLPPVRIVTDVTEVADAIKQAHRPREGASPRALGRTVFFIGAGCSVTAGVPGAPDIARRMVREIACNLFDAQSENPEECLAHIHRERPFSELALTLPGQAIDWHAVYDAMFKRYYSGPDDVRDLFDTLVEDARGAINWAHLCLGEIVKRRLVSTVITTNFDQLVLAGMVRAGVLPVVCDGLETLNRIAGQSRHPQLIELHGSRHTYFLRNRPEDVAAVGSDQGGTTALRSIFQHARNIVVVGYGGREDGVMDVLVRAARDFPDKHIFWVAYSPSPADLSPKARDFLGTSRNAGLLLGQDADTFFLDLCRILRIGAPGTIARPLETRQRAGYAGRS